MPSVLMPSLSPVAVSRTTHIASTDQLLTEDNLALDSLGEAWYNIRQDLVFSSRWACCCLGASFSGADHALHLANELFKSISGISSLVSYIITGALADNDLLNAIRLQVPVRGSDMAFDSTGGNHLGAGEITQCLGAA